MKITPKDYANFEAMLEAHPQAAEAYLASLEHQAQPEIEKGFREFRQKTQEQRNEFRREFLQYALDIANLRTKLIERIIQKNKNIS